MLKGFARRMYSNPPVYGARIVKTVLTNPELYNLWLEDIRTMSNRISKMRQELKENIVK